MSAARHLHRAVAAHRRRLLARLALRAGVALALWLCLALLASAFLLPLLPPDWASAGLLAAVGVGLAAGFYRLRPLRSDFRRLRDPRFLSTAAALAGNNEKLRDLLVTGVDLDAWGEEGARKRGVSPELARAQVQAADRAAEELAREIAAASERASARLGHAPPRLPELPFALLALAALLLTVFAGPEALRRPFGTAPATAEGVLDLADLRVTYHPPAYTGLPAVTEEGTDGEVRAYPGTRVTVEGRLSLPVEGGELSAPGDAPAPVVFEGQTLRAEWTVKAEGSYRLSVARNGKNYAFRPRRITLLVDAPPTVDLLLPEGDLEARTSTEIPVRYRVRDDFAVGRVELVLQGAEEVRLPLGFPGGREGEGQTVFLPASHPKLGDGAYLRVAAFDNDDVGGPKEGSSRTVFVSFLSRSRMEEEIANLESRLMEALLTHLADHLEQPAPAGEALARLKESAAGVLKLLGTVLERVARGQEEGLYGEAAIVNIEAGLRGAVAAWMDAPVDGQPFLILELERDILFLDALARELRMEEALSLGEELSALQRDLGQRLKQGEDAKSLERTVERIESLLKAMSKKLAAEGELPDGFANADAVREPPKDALGEMLKELREALKKGDRARAEELADKIAKALSKWLEDLEKAADAQSVAANDPIRKEMDAIAAEARDISAEQERLLGETRKIADSASVRSSEAQRAALRDFLARQQARLDEITRTTGELESLVPREKLYSVRPEPGKASPAERIMENRNRVAQAARQVRAALEQRLGDALAELDKVRDAVEGVARETAPLLEEDDRDEASRLAQDAQAQADDIAKDLEELLAKRAEALDPAERAGSKALSGEEGEVGRRIGEVEKRLSELGKKSPFVGGSLPGLAGKAKQGASDAKGSLGGENPFAAVPQERGVLEALSELDSGMQNAMEQMGGAPGQRRGEGQGQRSGGRSGRGREVDRSHVEIPAEAEARQWREFREEVLKAMKDGRVPEKYRQEVERYYEELIR